MRQAGECRNRNNPGSQRCILTVGAGIFLIGQDMNGQYELGYRAMVETIASGRSIHDMLNAILANERGHLYVGSMTCVLHSFLALRRAGFGFRHADPRLDKCFTADEASMLIEMNRLNTVGTLKFWGAVASAVSSCREFLSFKEPPQAPQAPIAVQLVNWPAEPTQVQVVAMPERITSTEVERDQDGNITAARQVERDGGMPSMPLQPLAA